MTKVYSDASMFTLKNFLEQKEINFLKTLR